MKRVFSLFLALVMLVGMVPVPAKASQTNPSVDANDMTVEGTDSFGSLLSEELNGESILADTYIDGYAITDLTFEGNTAAVTYGSLGPARLVVSIYTEDGLTMLSTANTDVSEGEGEVTLTMPGEMPEYFYAAAFLLNPDDLTPLCDSYDTPMYTREMQELLDSTVADYDADLVMNLDTREDTNFLVFEEDTIRAESSGAVNTVISADDEKLLYVIGNADETVLGLQRGDVFSCAYGNNNLLIVKVDSLSVDGDTVTITGLDLEMEEVFSHVKIEYEGGAADVEVDDSGCYEGIIYAGKEDSGSTYAARRSTYAEGSAEDTLELKFILDEVKIGEAKMEGSLKITPTAKFNYYATSDRKYVDLSISLKVTLGVTFKGKVPLKNAPLGDWGISPVPGVYIGFKPAFVVEFEASLSFGLTFFTETGITYEVGKAPKRHNVKPTVDIDIQVEGKLFVGIDLDPTVEVVGGKIIDLTLEMGFGFELTGKMGGQLYDGIQIAGQKNQEEKQHSCNHCLGVDVVFKAEMSFKIEFLKLKALTKEFKLAVLKIDLGSFYYSFTFGEFGWGGCPHLSYRVIIQVKDKDGNVMEGTPVFDGKGKELGKTDEKGQVIVYRVEGEYTFSATVNGTKLQKTKKVSRASRVLLSQGVGTGLSAIFGALEEEDVTNYGEVVMDGECGDFTTWVFYENGTLIIEGEGDITVPSGYWSEYQDDIETLVIREGVTSIPAQMFSGYTNLTTLLIADTVISWGSAAFQYCTGLKYVSVPVDFVPCVSFSGSRNVYGLFDGCNNVEYLRYTPGETGVMADRNFTLWGEAAYKYTMEYDSQKTLKTVEFADGITHIGENAFNYVIALETVVFSCDLESIGGGAFMECASLRDLELPDGLATIGGSAFSGCTGITELEIPDSVTSIGGYAFRDCAGITRLVVPDSVTEWGTGAFAGCTGLNYVSVPVDYTAYVMDSYHEYAYGLFDGCNNVEHIRYTPGLTGIMQDRNETYSRYNQYHKIEYYTAYESTMEYDSRATLKKVEFAEGVTYIGATAFIGGEALEDVTLPSTLKTIGSCAFQNCIALSRIDLPDGLTALDYGAFYGCSSMTGIKTLPSSLVTVGGSAFRDCVSITEMEVPDSVTSIQSYAFAGCTGLTKVIIPDSITEWGQESFAGCTGLKYVSVPVDYTAYIMDRYHEYAYGLFDGCNNVEYIRYTPGITGIMQDRNETYSRYNQYHKIEYHTAYESTMEYDSRETLKKVEFAEGVIHIGAEAFINCAVLESAPLPSTLESIGSGAFSGCSSLRDVVLPDGLTKIEPHTFKDCTSITEIKIPDSVTSIGYYAFRNCTGMTRLEIPDSVTEWGQEAFAGCTGLKYVSVPVDYTAYVMDTYKDYAYGVFDGCNNVEHIRYTPGQTGIMQDRDETYSRYNQYHKIEYYTAYESTMEYDSRETLKKVEFAEGITHIGTSAFVGVTANVYYDDESDVWTEDKRTGYGGNLTWLPLSALEETPQEEIPEETTEPAEETYEEVTEPVEEIPEVTETPETTEVTIPVAEGASSSASDPSGVGRELYSIFGGDYGTEETETQTLTVASFSGLVAGEEYVLLVVRNLKAADMLDGSNLIYIAQDAAEADGTLTFRYAKREDVKQSYVMVVGPSGKDLKDAVITFPAMEADGELHTVNPTVTYDGKVLTEGKDYNILGAGSYVKPGEYVCYIQGIHDYSGLVTCTYTVEGGIPGDVDLNGNVDVDDVLALLWYVLFPDDYPIDAEADFDKNGSVDVDDVLTLLWYVLFPEDYPL